MKACDILCTFFIHSPFLLCVIVSIESSDTPDVIGNVDTRKFELTSLFVSAGLGDIIVLSAPVIDDTNAVYYLSDPKGDNKKLNINTTLFTTDEETSRIKNYDYHNTNVTKEGRVKTIMGTTKKRKIISLSNENYESNCLYNDFERKPNDFTVGPLGEDDHGNWVLSLYVKGNYGDWNELFQVITINIVESIPAHAPKTKLILGETFEPRFLYPINNLQSCEIRPPRTVFDRFYDRDRFNMDSCGFRIPNVTRDDEGTWTILGVGKFVYKGEVNLLIDDEDL